MKILKPNKQRAENAMLLIWIMLALEIVALISSYLQYDLLQTVAGGGQISMEQADVNDIREQIIGIISSVAYVISVITFILWFRRAYYNLHQKVNYLSYSEGWAAGSWFVPILNLFRPFKIMEELYEETKAFLIKKGVSINTNITTSIVGWWWALWIINGIVGNVIFRYSINAESVDELIIATVLSMIGNLLGIPLALITIKVIRDYAKVELLLNDVKE